MSLQLGVINVQRGGSERESGVSPRTAARAKMREVGNLKAGSADAATAIRPPISLPPWNHISKIAKSSRLRRRDKMLGAATSDHQDAHRQLPPAARGASTALGPIRKPSGREFHGLVPRTRVYEPAAASLRHNSFSGVVASLGCRELTLPCVGYLDDFATLAQRELISDAR